jgi:glutamyl-tRNA synthetase
LKRRGYQPEALIKYALDVGVTQNDKSVGKEDFFKALDHFNKEVLESKSNRYFFVANPKEIRIQGAPRQEVSLDLHPDYPKRGKRKFKTNEKFLISYEDYKAIKDGELVRLMDCLNFVKEKGKFKFDSTSYERYKAKGSKIIHWLPAQGNIDVELLMDDNRLVKGKAEALVGKLQKGDVVQFERVGFCRMDAKNKFWFGHR